MRNPSITAFLLLLPMAMAWGQPQPLENDAAEISKVAAAFKIISQKPDSALHIAQQGLLDAKRRGNKRLAANAYKTAGWAWLHKGIYDTAFPFLLQARDLFMQMHDTREEMSMDINLAMAYSMRSQFSRGAKYLMMADSLTKLVKDPRVEGEVKRQMGILYREQGDYKKAIGYFKESMDKFKSIGDTLFYYDAIGSLCIVYMSMSEPDSSLKLLQENIAMINAMSGRNYERAMFQERFGDAWFALGKYEKAMESYLNAYKIFDTDNNKADMAYESINVGKTYGALKNNRAAEHFLLISYRLNDSLRITNYAHDAAMHLADLYKAMGNWKEAYHWLSTESALQDSLSRDDETEKTAQLQAKYETEKKDEEISLLKKDQELSRANLQRQKAFQIGLILLALLLILIGALVINRYRIVQKTRRLIEMEKMRNHIARDLHDDMGSTLSSINIISKVALENADEGVKLGEHLRTIHENSGFMLENMSDIVWTISPGNDTLEKVLFKMKEFAADILEPLNIHYDFNQAEGFDHVRLGLRVRKDLYLVYKEAINNAAKYSRCTKIDIDLSGNERQVLMCVRDNGIGFDKNDIMARSGNGLKNMEERARQLGGQLTINSAKGQGTSVELRLKSHD